MTNNEDELVKKYERLIYLAIKNKHIYWKTNDEFQDYIDSGYDGIIKGIRTFDSTKGVKESTYVYNCIATEIKRRIYTNTMVKRKTKTVSLNLILNDDGDEMIDLIPSDYDMEQVVEDNIRNDKLLALVNKLSKEKQREVIKNLYGLEGKEPISASELGRRWNCSKSNIIAIKNRALRILWYKIRNYGL